ncbi:TPA: hypothetical protein ACKQB3_000463 [Stenotrophomonas maltophilia]
MANKSEQKPTATPAPSQHPTPTPSTTPDKSPAEDSRTLEQLEKEEDELRAKIAAIEEVKKGKLAAEAAKAFNNILASIRQFAEHFNADQVEEIVEEVYERSASESSSVASKSTKKTTKKTVRKSAAKKIARIAKSYQLPTGETYGGKGPTPQAFKDWAESTAGKKWREQNPGQKWPSA